VSRRAISATRGSPLRKSSSLLPTGASINATGNAATAIAATNNTTPLAQTTNAAAVVAVDDDDKNAIEHKSACVFFSCAFV
jgi:hypothetical protein